MSKDKQYIVYMPNTAFVGKRNVGRNSKLFKRGKSEPLTKNEAQFFIDHFDYLCPQLRPEDQEKVDDLYAKPISEEQAKLETGAADDEVRGEKHTEPEPEPAKVEVEFIKDHKIGKNEFTPGQKHDFKTKYAQSLVDKGIAKLSG